MVCVTKLPKCKTIPKSNLKMIYLFQVNDQKVTMLFFEDFSVKIHFFKLELFQVLIIHLIPSSQNFVTFLLKTDKSISLQILKYSQSCLILLSISWINLQSMWKLVFLHKLRFPDKGKNNHRPSHVKQVFQIFMINIRIYCNKIK